MERKITIRNYVARELWTSKFKKQVLRDRKNYTRKIKHKKQNTTE